MAFQKQLLVAVFLAVLAPVLGQNVTLPQYLRCLNDSVPSTVNRKCHLYVYHPLSFDDAEAYCNEFTGGHLARINNAAINDLVSSQAVAFFNCSSAMWLGGRARNVSQRTLFVWNRLNSLVTYDNFGDVSGINPVNTCIFMDISNKTWSYGPCNVKRAFVCEMPVFVARCPAGWSYFGDTDSCYKASSAPSLYTFNQAETNCTVQGGHLVSIHNETENTFVSNLASTLYFNDTRQQCLIGLKFDANATYTWTDGSDSDFTHFADGSWNDYTNKCAVIHPDGDKHGLFPGKWMAQPCNQAFGRFVCKKPSQRVPRFYEQ